MLASPHSLALTPSACSVGCIVGIVCGVIGVLLIVVFLLGGSIVVYKFKGKVCM